MKGDYMLTVQYDLKRRDALKGMFIRLRSEEAEESIREDLNRLIEEVGVVGFLLIKQTLIHNDEDVTIEDARKMSALDLQLINDDALEQSHPISLFKQENALFQSTLKEVWRLLTLLEEEEQLDTIEELQQKIYQLGEFHKHYHRKEKLLFPLLERYGHVQPGRLMWKNDDRIRASYLGIKRRIEQFPNTNIKFIKKRYLDFQAMFMNMIYEEEAILFPIVLAIFKDEEWKAVAVESEAFGYAMIDVEEVWKAADEQQKISEHSNGSEEHFRFGGGYLTTEEANLILNNLPLEITFVDKNNVFKYFNEMTEASEMMLVRTPISIGRNVANCHPPKSLKKVMALMRDLIAQRRTSESMWFKKNGQYIHLTYKALFNDEGEYIGILEYVQDIQPFFELPEEVKMGLSPIVE